MDYGREKLKRCMIIILRIKVTLYAVLYFIRVCTLYILCMLKIPTFGYVDSDRNKTALIERYVIAHHASQAIDNS